jgi:hypothetical protein
VSGAAIGWAKRQRTGDSTRKLILMALADYAGPVKDDRDAPAEADGRHFAFVGVDTLAEECECSERTVNRTLTALKTSGHILRVRRMRGFSRTSDYTILACDGIGDRPFDVAEALLADALDSVDDKLSDTALISEHANMAVSVPDTLADAGTRHPRPPKPTPVSVTEADTHVGSVPCTGTTSNYEPQETLQPRDDLSPGFMVDTNSMAGVLSGHTPSITKEFGRKTKATTGEIMNAWQAWVPEKLPSFVVVEVEKIVKRCVADGVDRRTIANGLTDWTEAGMIAPKFRLPDAIAARAAAPLRRDSQKPTRTEETLRQVGDMTTAMAGRTAAELDDLLEATLRQSQAAGFGGAEALRAIRGPA